MSNAADDRAPAGSGLITDTAGNVIGSVSESADDRTLAESGLAAGIVGIARTWPAWLRAIIARTISSGIAAFLKAIKRSGERTN